MSRGSGCRLLSVRTGKMVIGLAFASILLLIGISMTIFPQRIILWWNDLGLSILRKFPEINVAKADVNELRRHYLHSRLYTFGVKAFRIGGILFIGVSVYVFYILLYTPA